MSFETSPYPGRKNVHRYRDTSQQGRDQTYTDSGSRKRGRGEGLLAQPRVGTENDLNKKRYEFYNPNQEFSEPAYVNNSRDQRRSDPKFRPNSRHSREVDMSTVAPKRIRSQQSNDQPPPKPSRVLGAFGLSYRTEERHLYNIMKKYGEIEEVKVVYDTGSGRSRGFGFIYFQSLEGARAARAACARGLELHGRVVRVDYSYTKKPHDPTPGTYIGKHRRMLSRPDPRRGPPPERRPRVPDYSNHRSRSRSPQQVRRRRGPDDAPDQFYEKHRVQSGSRSRSPLVYTNGRSRGPRDSVDMHSYRSQPSRHEFVRDVAYDLPHPAKGELLCLDRSPPMH